MTGAISQTVGGVFLLAGSFFLLVGAIGLLRMPDLFTRMHAASVGETLGGSLLIIGMMFHSGFSLVTFKLLVLLGVIFFFGPVATHALARAARYAEVEPKLSDPSPEQIPREAAAPDATPKAVKKPRRKQANARRKPVKKKGCEMTEALITMVLLTLMAAVTVGIIRLRNLFGVVILSGIYSFLMASVMMLLDAVDVAMTEASVGAGISTVLLLTVLYLTRSREMVPVHQPLIPMFLAIGVTVMLVYGSMDLPPFGSAETPVNQSAVSTHYLQKSIPETGIPNVVTSVLASYRGFDTLGEVTVVFVAGIGVLTLLRGRRKKHSVAAVKSGKNDKSGKRAST